MNSLDTNILVYAANEDCAEHAKAIRLVNDALSTPREWIIAEQVLFEYYKDFEGVGFEQLLNPIDPAENRDRRRLLDRGVRLHRAGGDDGGD